MNKVTEIIQQIIQQQFNTEVEVSLTRPRPEFGDFATNIAMQLAGKLGKNPREIAEILTNELSKNPLFEKIEIAGPGFINITISNKSLWDLANSKSEQIFANQKYVLEYSCPNAFKDLHTGHLYQTMYGDSLARVLEAAGADVQRTSFGGDVGLHVAKCLWGMRHELGGDNFEKLDEIVENNAFERAKWIGKTYVIGAKAYEDSEEAQAEITQINKDVYGFHDGVDQDSPLAKIYWKTRQWSFDYFDAFYNLIEVDLMHYYPESSTAPTGMEVVKEQLAKGNLKKSEGAIVFEGDESKHLHTRVFVTSNGLPTYETKDIGVIWKERADFNFDHRILMTGNDQKEYMRVVFVAADTFQPGIGAQMTHLTNGTVRFSDGKKMSSRLGNVSRAVDVLDEVKLRASNLTDDKTLQNQIALGAIKYAFAKYRLGGDIAFDVDETVSLQGNSGTYIQYAHARACSIISKAETQPEVSFNLNEGERKLLQKLSEFPNVVSKAATEYMVHGICRYLYELAQEFNRFYENNRVIGSDEEASRLALVTRYRDTLAEGLSLLGIHAPEKM